MSDPQAPQTRRLFFALWPSEELRNRIETEASAPIKRSGGRAIPARNLHVTLLFLGEVPAPRVEAVITGAAELKGRSFEIVFDQIEAWPGSNVLCMTSAHPPAALDELSERLRYQLAAREFEFRRQVFRLHVTLARDLPRMRMTERTAPLHWPVVDFVLVESNMTKTGSQYSVFARWPLAS
ncbi:MAG: RNA 2',3'-cyclic phosphodiesterase [Steroidobacter sp.]